MVCNKLFKKKNIYYELTNYNANDDKYFNVFLAYKGQLKSYKKKYFDPFCRKKRIAFYYDENTCVITTIGQLNFFKWAIEYDILTYVENNLQHITQDMNKSNKLIYESKFTENSKSTDQSTIDFSNQSTNLNLDSNLSDTAILTNLMISSKSSKLSKSTKLIESKHTNSNTSDTDKIRKKRHELSVSATKSINVHNYSITLTFD